MAESSGDQPLSLGDFYAHPGLADWTFMFDGVLAIFETGSFDAGARFVSAVAELANAADHHPLLTVSYGTVSVRLVTHDVGWVTGKDADLAQQITELAGSLGYAVDVPAAQAVQVAVDGSMAGSHAFWRDALDYSERGGEDLTDPLGRGPAFWFQALTEERDAEPRLHLDVSVHPSQYRRRVAAALAAGGKDVTPVDGAPWTTIEAPDGNLVDFTAMGREVLE